MTLLSALSFVADIVVPPPTPPPSHAIVPIASPVPYLILAVVAMSGLWLLRRQRATGR